MGMEVESVGVDEIILGAFFLQSGKNRGTRHRSPKNANIWRGEEENGILQWSGARSKRDGRATLLRHIISYQALIMCCILEFRDGAVCTGIQRVSRK